MRANHRIKQIIFFILIISLILSLISSCNLFIGGLLGKSGSMIGGNGLDKDSSRYIAVPEGISVTEDSLYVLNSDEVITIQKDGYIKKNIKNNRAQYIAMRSGGPKGSAFLNNKLYTLHRSNKPGLSVIDIELDNVVKFAGLEFRRSKDGFGMEAGFDYLVGITTFRMYLYVTDGFNIRRIYPETGEVKTILGINGKGFQDGSFDKARFAKLWAITSDKTALYVADCGNNAIRKIDMQTQSVSTILTENENSSLNACNMYMTKHGNAIYYIDRCSISKLDLTTLQVELFAGSDAFFYPCGMRDGNGVDARFNNPRDIASDDEYLYVADYRNNAIRRINPKTREVTTLMFKEMQRSGQTFSFEFF